jgi:hypothetical protein
MCPVTTLTAVSQRILAVVETQIHHPNVGSFLESYFDAGSLVLVRSWSQNGGVMSGWPDDWSGQIRIVRYPRSATNFTLMPGRQLLDLAKGVAALHAANIVHGNVCVVRSFAWLFETLLTVIRITWSWMTRVVCRSWMRALTSA